MNALRTFFGGSAAGTRPSRFTIIPPSMLRNSRYSDCHQGAMCTAALIVTRSNRRQP